MLVPPDEAGADTASSARLAGLVRAGLIARRRRPVTRALLDAPPVPPSTGASAVDALLAERTEGR